MKGNNPALVIMDSLGSSIVKVEDMTEEQKETSKRFEQQFQDVLGTTNMKPSSTESMITDYFNQKYKRKPGQITTPYISDNMRKVISKLPAFTPETLMGNICSVQPMPENLVKDLIEVLGDNTFIIVSNKRK